MKLTIPDALVLHLAENRGQWIPGFSLEKVTVQGKYTGVSAMRTLRYLSADGFRIVNGVKYYIEKRMNKCFIEYRVPFAEKKVQKVEEVVLDGKVYMRVIQEVLKI